MILYWGRELAGWLLVLVGLGMLILVFLDLLGSHPHIISAPVVSFIGIIVFRGGIHLLKVAVAARVALRVQAELARQQADKRTTKAIAPWDW